MAQWRIEGRGFSFDLPSEIDLADYNRDVDIPRRRTARDGITVDIAAIRRESTVHILRGMIQKTTVALTLAEADKIQQTADSIKGEVFLVDTSANRRVAVTLIRSQIIRSPARILNVTITFRTTTNPYWEDDAFTTIKATSESFLNVPIGNAPTWGKLKIGATSNPSVVFGNWSFMSHIETGKATCLNSGTDSSPWGQITGVHTATNKQILPAKYGFGRKPISHVTFPSLIQRSTKFAAMIRFRAARSWATTASGHLFDFYDTTTLASHHFELILRNNTYVFGHADSSIFGTATTYALDKDIDIAVMFTAVATQLAGGTNVKIQMFENGIQIASTLAAFTGIQTQTLSKLNVGTNRLGTNPAHQIIDEVYFWNQPQSPRFLKGTQDAQRQLEADNKLFKYTATIGAPDYLLVDSELHHIKIQETSGVTLTNATKDFTGDFFKLGEGNSHSDGNVETMFTRQNGFSRELSYHKTNL